uniref:Septation protein imp2 n=1 Tax=Tolypocladium ophioglossoides (strain CBS 100239) TaxID=1163406 RepID=A0A0L0N8Y4_TOLOC
MKLRLWAQNFDSFVQTRVISALFPRYQLGSCSNLRTIEARAPSCPSPGKMPAEAADVPAVALSFANNFWGKDDAGVGPLLERMHGAKQTSDELKSFYSARASIEDEYSRKLLNLCRKSLGSQEMGTLKTSLDTVRGEVEAMAKQHQNIAAQMKTELEEPLVAFAGGMKERRKIVQNSVEKLLKTKLQQTQQVNKTRDKYEQECLKIKGYLAQGHMVMGQEERRNKAKLEKTQISLATANTEYENAVKALEDTTARWNREWKAAADKFQDLEEERLDFTKSSLWTFANVASTVCVSDDASCEKIRLSLEKMEVEKDIIGFITERGTGQEIPDPPKYINFCRGDITDSQSEVSEDENYSVAQFPRSINPAFRSSSPQPSTFESHHDPNSALAHNLAHREPMPSTSREATATPQKVPQPMRMSMDEQHPYDLNHRAPAAQSQHDLNHHGPLAAVPHDPYPMDGMTMLCRTGPPSDRSSQHTSARPSSQESHSDYSNPTSFSSQEPPSGKASPVKQDPAPARTPEKRVLKKKSGFFQGHSPFRRKSTKEVQAPGQVSRNTWQVANPRRNGQMERTASPEPIDANASLALGVGQNVLPVTTPDTQRRKGRAPEPELDENDPIAGALAELKEVNLGKQSSVRMSADHYHGIATPAPGAESRASRSIPVPGSHDTAATSRGTPPPSYQHPAQISRLGVPPPAVTSKAMKEASKKVADQTRTVFGNAGRGDAGRGDAGSRGASPSSRPGTRGNDMPRAASPAPTRGASPQPRMTHDPRGGGYRSASPNPYSGHHKNSSQASMPHSRGSDQGYYGSASPSGSARGASPSSYRDYNRPQSSYGGADMAVQLAPVGDDPYGSQRSRGSGRPDSRAMGLYDGGSRPRSKSVADPARQYSRDGRPILHFARALYMYQAAIPEELGFTKGDYLAVFRHQDDGWWEAEVHGANGRPGLVPSNYLQAC